jgi:hypothetical protein
MLHFAHELYIPFLMTTYIMLMQVNVTGILKWLSISIARVFEENGQLVPKHKGGVCYPILQDKHI